MNSNYIYSILKCTVAIVSIVSTKSPVIDFASSKSFSGVKLLPESGML